jgi:hypothetical protein
MKSTPKRATEGSVATSHHDGTKENSTKLRRIASVNGTRIVRYQCLCCEPEAALAPRRIKSSQRFKAASS